MRSRPVVISTGGRKRRPALIGDEIGIAHPIAVGHPAAESAGDNVPLVIIRRSALMQWEKQAGYETGIKCGHGNGISAVTTALKKFMGAVVQVLGPGCIVIR